MGTTRSDHLQRRGLVLCLRDRPGDRGSPQSGSGRLGSASSRVYRSGPRLGQGKNPRRRLDLGSGHPQNRKPLAFALFRFHFGKPKVRAGVGHGRSPRSGSSKRRMEGSGSGAGIRNPQGSLQRVGFQRLPRRDRTTLDRLGFLLFRHLPGGSGSGDWQTCVGSPASSCGHPSPRQRPPRESRSGNRRTGYHS